MHITPTTVPISSPIRARGRPLGARSMSVSDQLRDLRIDGYDVVFVERVALLPVEIDERATAQARESAPTRGAGYG